MSNRPTVLVCLKWILAIGVDRNGCLSKLCLSDSGISPVAESASFAELHINGDPRAACFHARHALERLVKRLFKIDKQLKPPHVQNLGGCMSDETFVQVVPEEVLQKMQYIRKAGNDAVHGNKSPPPEKAKDVVQELFHVLYWTGRSYLRRGAEELKGAEYKDAIALASASGTIPII